MNEQDCNKRNYETAKDEADIIDERIIATLQAGNSFRVEAGAGSGKTYSLIKAIEWIQSNKQKEYKISKKQVICITYTNAAVDVIKERLEPDSFIIPSTIHSFAWNAIKQFQHVLLDIIEKDDNFKNEEGDFTKVEKDNYTLGHRYKEMGVQYLHHNDRTDYIDVKIIKLADKAAGLLNMCDVRELLEKEYAKGGSAWLVPYGRYASAAQISTLISTMRKWENWYAYGTTGRSDIIIARGALMLSETREAMLNIDKSGLLADYAKLRGTDADSIRDSVLSEFGLDASGKKEYDLGSKTVIVSLAQDLSLVIYDTAEDKIVKSIPKKGTDPELVEKAAADFAQMKKNAKKVVKGRNDKLFEDFLSGKTRPAKSWITSYTKNPLLKRVAELIVWNQGKSTFILTSDGAVDCNGNTYEINKKTAIGVAHPIEMKKTEIEAWQKYFTSRGLKQPFSQIWEPAIDKDSIKADRYIDCLIPFYRFRSQEKHGITVEDNDFHNEIFIHFDDCNVGVARIDWHRHEINNDDNFEVTSFSFREYTRKVNHIVAYLDRITVTGRILKDDTTISMYLEEFTLAQITEFINLAIENNCVNCLAVLMDYKNNKYSTYDPMDAFTLE